MDDTPRLPNPVLILIAASVMMSLAIGMRQCLGLFLPPVTHALGLSAADYTFGIAAQNIAWGVAQAPLGAIADQLGPAAGAAAGRGALCRCDGWS